MPDLLVDADRLLDARRRIALALGGLESARLDPALAEAVGHPDLVGALRDLHDGWTLRRSRLADGLERLAETAGRLGETYLRLEGEIADGVATSGPRP